MDDMDVEAIDFRDEIRQRVEPGFDLTPVVLRPVLYELLHGRKLHALRRIRHLLLVGPIDCREAPARVGKPFFGYVDSERPYARSVCCGDAVRQKSGSTGGGG